MGFDPARVDWALRATGHRGLQPAMDHLLEHEGEPIPDPSAAASATQPPIAPNQDDGDDEDTEALRHLESAGEAKSIKCSLCGKVFKNTALANFHAEKSSHDQFEESTEEIRPLTEQEKQAKLAELREKMAAKRNVRAQEEAKEAKANEALKRKQGKDLNKLKEELRNKEIIKEAEQKRREKAEDVKARAAIKAQIEADKQARAEKAAREKALREGKPVIDNPAASGIPPPAAVTSSSSSTVAGKDFKDTRLQIRLASGGAPYTTTLPSESTLQDVAEFVAAQSLSVSVDTVTFTQHFPRPFSRSDFTKTLRELGLTPSAVLIAS